MKKHNILIRIVVILFTALLIAGGLTIPGSLLKKQEENILGLMQKQQMNGKSPLSVSEVEPTPVDRTLSYDEVVARITLWRDSGNSLVAREPLEDELTMEQASKKGLEELRELIGLGVVPEIDFNALKLSSAVLNTCVYRNRTMGANEAIGEHARWYMVYISNGVVKQEVQVSLDANDGRIYQVQLSSDNVEGFLEPSREDAINAAFALYHGIDVEKDGTFSAMYLPRADMTAVLTDEQPENLPTMKVEVQSNAQ